MVATTKAAPANSYNADADLHWPANPHTSKGAEHKTSANPSAPAQVLAASHSQNCQTQANTPSNPTLTPTPAPTPTTTHIATHNPVTQVQPQQSKCIALLTPWSYSNLALHHLALEALHTNALTFQPLCFAVIHPTTGESITKYKCLQNNPLL